MSARIFDAELKEILPFVHLISTMYILLSICYSPITFKVL